MKLRMRNTAQAHPRTPNYYYKGKLPSTVKQRGRYKRRPESDEEYDALSEGFR